MIKVEMNTEVSDVDVRWFVPRQELGGLSKGMLLSRYNVFYTHHPDLGWF
jgi:hypothetical protein